VDAVISSLQGDHDREILDGLRTALGGTAVPVLSWKDLFTAGCRLPAASVTGS
jgi:hypothetical protein